MGTGTGALLPELGAAFPGASLAAVDLAPGMIAAARARWPGAALAVADAEALPLRTGAFDLVLSTSVLQWTASLDGALGEMARVRAPGGTVAVAFFGGETLFELTDAWRAVLPAGVADRTHRFHGPADLVRAFERAGLRASELATERVVERHADAFALLRSLRDIGAANASPGMAGVGLRRIVTRMAEVYRARHGSEDGVTATWDVVVGIAR